MSTGFFDFQKNAVRSDLPIYFFRVFDEGNECEKERKRQRTHLIIQYQSCMGVHGAKAVEFKNKKAEANQFAKIVPTEQKKTKKEKV